MSFFNGGDSLVWMGYFLNNIVFCGIFMLKSSGFDSISCILDNYAIENS